MSALPLALRAVPAALLIVAALTACGGGGGSTATPPPPPPVGVPAPSALADAVATPRNASTTISVLANDSVTNNGTLKLVSATTPAHGSATISGDKIVYAPVAGFYGKDTFSYTAKDIGAGTATATADVTVTVTAAVTLAGKTVDVPGDATVTIEVGARTFAASTDATGNFSVPVTLDAPASMIMITVQGTGAKSFIKLASQLGDSQSVLNAAGAGTSVSAANLPGLNVTGITTALHVHAVIKNEGAIPATQLALEASTSHIAASELTQMGAMIRSLTGKAGAAPWRTLPAGTSDTLALVTNRGAYVAFVKPISDLVMYPEMEAFDRDADTGVAPTVAPGSRKSLNFYYNGGCCARPAIELLLNPDGSGSFLRGNQKYVGTWRKDAALTMTLTTPEVRTELVDDGPHYAQVEHITREVTMRQFSGTPEQGFANVVFSGVIHYVNGEHPDAPFSTGLILAFTDWDSLTLPLDLAGAALAGVPDLFDPAFTSQMVVGLSPDGGAASQQVQGDFLSWKIENGKLVLTYRGGETLTLGRVRAHANGEERWLVRGSSASGYQIGETMIVRPQNGLAFTEENAVQRWLSSPHHNFIGTKSFFKVLADHTSGSETEQTNGLIAAGGKTSWKIEGGMLVMRSYRTSAGLSVPVCPTGASCTLRTEQAWTMLRSDASSIVVFENYMTSPGVFRRRVLRYGRN